MRVGPVCRRLCDDCRSTNQGIVADQMVGRTYLERGRPVVVVTRWGPGGGPRNVAVRREDGSTVVRPFRGLRRPKDQT
jgi:acetyl esterase